MLAALLLALVPSAPRSEGAEPDGTPAPERPLVLRLHPLAGLVEAHGGASGALSLLPYRVMAGQVDVESGRSEQAAALLGAEDVIALVREVVEPAVWEELPGATIDLQGGGDRMIVVAPQETQDAVAEFLAHLGAKLVPRELLEVRVVPATDADLAGEAVLDLAEAERRLADRDSSGRVNVALRGRAVVGARDVESATIVYDYEVEIAQGATVADPIVDTVSTGLEVLARSARVEGGSLVALLARASDTARATVDRRVAAKSLVNAKPVMSERFAAGVFQHPQLAFASFAGTIFVPDGKAVWIPVAVETHVGPVRFALDVRVTGPLAPFRATYEPSRQDAQEPYRFELVGRGAVGLGAVEIPRIGRRLFDDRWTDALGSETVWAFLPPVDEDGMLVDFVQRVAGEVLDAGHGSVGYAAGSVRTWLPRPFGDRVATALAPLQRFESGLVLRGRVLLDGEARAAFRAPLVLDRPLAIWGGVQGTRLADWDVDVANEAQACNPDPEAWVDGFALRVLVARAATSELMIDANAKLHLLLEPPAPVELQDESRLTIDRIHARTLHVDEVRMLPVQGGRLRFGDALALELEVAAAAH